MSCSHRVALNLTLCCENGPDTLPRAQYCTIEKQCLKEETPNITSFFLGKNNTSFGSLAVFTFMFCTAVAMSKHEKKQCQRHALFREIISMGS